MRIFKNKAYQFIFCIITAIVVMCCFSSCVATEKQRKRFLAAHCVGKDSVRIEYKDKIVLKDTTIYKTTAGPIQYLENPCKTLCDSLGNLKPFSVTKKEKGIKSTVFSVGNSIASKCDIDSMAVSLQWTEHHTAKTETSHTEKVIQKDCELEHRTKFDGFTFWWFWITAGILALYILIKIFKGYLKAYLPFLK